MITQWLVAPKLVLNSHGLYLHGQILTGTLKCVWCHLAAQVFGCHDICR